MTRYILIDPADHIYTTPNGSPLWASAPHALFTVRIDATHTAARLPATPHTLTAEPGVQTVEPRAFFNTEFGFLISQAVALVRHREAFEFDPLTGEKITWSADNTRAFGTRGREYFPRIDPAVIGLIEHAFEPRLLVGRNIRRSYFSLIAGYIAPGETMEQAFAREVWEEAGRRVSDIVYVASQPWPTSSSLMFGVRATTSDDTAIGECDGELAEIRWITRADIHHSTLPLAPEGSLAHRMIQDWANTT